MTKEKGGMGQMIKGEHIQLTILHLLAVSAASFRH